MKGFKKPPPDNILERQLSFHSKPHLAAFGLLCPPTARYPDCLLGKLKQDHPFVMCNKASEGNSVSYHPGAILFKTCSRKAPSSVPAVSESYLCSFFLLSSVMSVKM